MRRFISILTAAAGLGVAVAGAPALADHVHLTVDTAQTQEGGQVYLVAGYLPTESAITITDGRVTRDGEIAVFRAADVITSGPLAGWYGGFDVLLTSDYYFFTGRLDGGNFMWELASVADVRGGSAAVAAWGLFEGAFIPSAISSAAQRAARSFDTAAGGHEHEQAYAFSEPGLYDLTFIGWDSNGAYPVDSDEVTIRVLVGCLADYNRDGFVDGIDYDQFNNDFEAGLPGADLNGDGFVDGIDYDSFMNAFEGGGC